MTSWQVMVRVRRGELDLDVTFEGDDKPLALVGPNGSGKTSVLRAIAGVLAVRDARVTVGDTILEDTSAGIRVPTEERRIGYVPQGFGLFPHLTVLENVEFGLSTGKNRIRPEERSRRALQMLSELNCASLAGRSVEHLSGGEKQRIALARSLVLEPGLLLLDEPLAALDATLRRRLRRFLAERLFMFRGPSITVTHDVRDVAALGAQIVALEHGRVVQQGPLSLIQQSPATEFLAEFVGAD
ncbi:MAG TPA: ABC transporter ATP-binding protein [Gemmatimonadetes bacterium]|nr:ABC transporter ATP-binding protein [Gemmatimonadota bacterium]